MNKNKIDFLKEILNKKGYNYDVISDYEIEVIFSKCKVIIWETVHNTIYFEIVDNDNNTVFEKTYKTINNVIRYGFKHIID